MDFKEVLEPALESVCLKLGLLSYYYTNPNYTINSRTSYYYNLLVFEEK